MLWRNRFVCEDFSLFLPAPAPPRPRLGLGGAQRARSYETEPETRSHASLGPQLRHTADWEQAARGSADKDQASNKEMRCCVLLVLAAVLGLAVTTTLDTLQPEARAHSRYQQSLAAFHDFMAVHNKSYGSRAEYKTRYQIFRSNMKLVAQLQAMEQGSAVYGASPLADLSQEEFRRGYLGYSSADPDPDIHWPPAHIPDMELPDSWDWRDKGAVSEVKNQGGG